MNYKSDYKPRRAIFWWSLKNVVNHFYDNRSVEYVDENDHRITRQPIQLNGSAN